MTVATSTQTFQDYKKQEDIEAQKLQSRKAMLQAIAKYKKAKQQRIAKRKVKKSQYLTKLQLKRN